MAIGVPSLLDPVFQMTTRELPRKARALLQPRSRQREKLIIDVTDIADQLMLMSERLAAAKPADYGLTGAEFFRLQFNLETAMQDLVFARPTVRRVDRDTKGVVKRKEVVS